MTALPYQVIPIPVNEVQENPLPWELKLTSISCVYWVSMVVIFLLV